MACYVFYTIKPLMLTIDIPCQIKRTGARTLISSPVVVARPKRAHNKALIKDLTEAWYWQKLLDDGKFKSTYELAHKLNMNPADVRRRVRMVLLAPDIKRAILDGTQPLTMNTRTFRKSWPDLWTEQRRYFGFDDTQLSDDLSIYSIPSDTSC
jgi:hypothetical protein